MISKILLTPLAVVRLILIFGTMILWLLSFWLSCLFIPYTKERGFKLRRHWLKYIAIPVINLKIESQGKPHNGPALYVCNHRSFTDPVVVCHFIDAFVIAKAEVAKYPIINKGAEVTGVLWVNRENKESRNSVRELLVDTIVSGHNVLVFPEGTVGTQRHSIPFRSGTFHESVEHKIVVVPIALDYRDNKDMWLSGMSLVKVVFNQLSSLCTEVKIHIGEAMTSDDGEALKAHCQRWINTHLDEIHANWTRIDFEKQNGGTA